jgi:predicted cupin superfamily sugar epimerase
MAAAAAQIVATLGLQAHPEGGYFRETYRAAEQVRTSRGPRSAATAILYLVTAAAPSHFHRLQADEIWLHQGGAPLELVTLSPNGTAQSVTLGPPAQSAEPRPHALVPALTWQAARVACGSAAAGDAGEADEWSLVSCVVTPGFDYEDFELGRREDLLSGWSDARDLVLALT